MKTFYSIAFCIYVFTLLKGVEYFCPEIKGICVQVSCRTDAVARDIFSLVVQHMNINEHVFFGLSFMKGSFSFAESFSSRPDLFIFNAPFVQMASISSLTIISDWKSLRHPAGKALTKTGFVRISCSTSDSAFILKCSIL